MSQGLEGSFELQMSWRLGIYFLSSFAMKRTAAVFCMSHLKHRKARQALHHLTGPRRV